MLLATDERADAVADIVVVGVGGSGNNAINRMIEMNVSGVKYIAMNTDKQTLAATQADEQVQLGEKVTEGLGAGADPEKGRLAAEENEDDIREMLRGKNMVFVTAGMGGGTGTGAAPVIARIAKEEGCLTVAVVNTPFSFENRPILERAAYGVEELQKNVDSLIVIPNDNIYAAGDGKGGKVPMSEAMKLANDVLRQAVQGITDLIVRHGDVNRDFADVSRVMRDKGLAHIGIGIGTGDDMALDAITRAVESPLLNTSIDTATHVLLNIVGIVTPEDLRTIFEYIRGKAGDSVEILYGIREEGDPGECTITLIATGMTSPVTQGMTQKVTRPRSAAASQGAPRYERRGGLPVTRGAGVGTGPIGHPIQQNTSIPQDEYLDDPDVPEAPQQTSIFDRPQQTLQFPSKNGGQGVGTSNIPRVGQGTTAIGRQGAAGGAVSQGTASLNGATGRIPRGSLRRDDGGDWKMPSFMSKQKKDDQ